MSQQSVLSTSNSARKGFVTWRVNRPWQTLVVIALLALGWNVNAQPISRPVPFTLSASDTSHSDFLPSIEKPAGNHGAWHLSPEGHYTAQDGTHLKFFGTEIQWTANFIDAASAKIFAKRISKLGFNALRLNYYDYFGWDDASVFRTYDDAGVVSTSSYLVNTTQLARLDTLIYTLKQEGIYTFLPLNSYHPFSYNEGITTWDSMYAHGDIMPFIYPQAAALEAAWAKTLLSHINPLTGIAYGKDPAIACYEMLQEQSLSWFWSLKRLNYIDAANALSAGLATVSYSQSRRIDTLFSDYLRRKYGTDQALARAWSGPDVGNVQNLMKNGSFESFDNSNWTIAINPPAHATQLISAEGQDGTPATLIHIPSVDTTHSPYAIVFINTSAITGKDSMYQYSFYARIRYEAAKGVKTKSIIAYIADVNGAQSLVAPVTIDTNWKRYTFTYRSASSSLQYVGVLMAGEFGDVMLDNFDLRHVAEQGLRQQESMTNSTVYRITYDSAAMASPYRVRDLAMFYDSLQQTFYHRMDRLIRDTLQSAGLVNYSQANYWGLIPSYHTYKDAQVTALHTGWDYVSARPNGVYNDSTWEIRNTPMVRDPGMYALSIATAASVVGKAHVVGWSTPVANQSTSENVIIPVTYAAYQDWDGFFLTPYAGRREELFADTLTPGYNTYSWSNIGSNHAIMSLVPAASEIFRHGRVAPAQFFDTIRHDASDVFLFPHYADYRGAFSQEGYIGGDQGILTYIGVRSQFDSPTHQLAAENTYTPGDTLNHSEDNRIMWDPAHGIFMATEPTAYVFTGFPTDTIAFPRLKFVRTDNSSDNLSMYYLLADPTSEVKHSLLSIATRVQNTGTRWIDSLTFGKNSGTAPTIISAVRASISIQSDAQGVTIYPLDSTGNRTKAFINTEKNGNWFTGIIDQQLTRTAWFDVVESGTNSVVNVSPTSAYEMAISPNPSAGRSTISLSLPASQSVSISLVDDLGREVKSVATGTFRAGSSTIALDATSLPTGHYILRLMSAAGILTRKLNVIR